MKQVTIEDLVDYLGQYPRDTILVLEVEGYKDDGKETPVVFLDIAMEQLSDDE